MKIKVNIRNGSQFITRNPKTINEWKSNKGNLVKISEYQECSKCTKEFINLKEHNKIKHSI